MLREHPRRSAALLGAFALCAALLAGCAPAPTPTPTPTPAFASDDEAFAAAEKVYRAYVAAGNTRSAGDAEPDPQDFLIGDALEGDIDAQRYFKSAGVALVGPIQVVSFAQGSVERQRTGSRVEAHVCLDVSAARLTDSSGVDVTPASRPELVAQTVTLVHLDGAFLVSSESEGDDTQCGEH